MSGMLLAINPYIGPLDDNGDVAGYYGPINCSAFAITQPDPTTVNRESYLRDSAGSALDSYARPQPAEIEFTTDEVDPDILAMAMAGTPANYAQTEQTDTAVQITAAHDKWVAVGYNHLTALAAEVAAAAKTLGTDYLVDMTAGLFMALSTGTIADEATVDLTIDADARSGKKTIAATVTSLAVKILGSGLNTFNNHAVDLVVHKAAIALSGGLNFVSSAPVSMTFKGTLVTPTGETGPYEVTDHAAA